VSAARLCCLCLALLAFAAAAVALHLGLWRYGSPGPGLFPFLAALLLLATALAALRDRGEQAEGAEPIDRPRFLRYGAAILVFMLLLKPLGALLASIGLFLAVLRGIERRSWLAAASVALVAAVGSWGLFRETLGVPLPRGLLGLG